VIALSGLDGSGKSTQAEALEQALNALGYPVVKIWTSVTAHPSLGLLAAPARALLGHKRRAQPTGLQPGLQPGAPAAGEDDDRLTRLRESRRWLHLSWVSVVATIHAWWQARALRPHLLRGRVVICDRYTLDSLVHLRYRYGAQHRYRLQLALIRLLSPRPTRAYLLDVSPETAYARNQEYTREQTKLRARLYREDYPALGVTRLDGERSREELCEQVALEVWSELRTERDTGRPALLRALHAVYRRVPRCGGRSPR
jgi:thymidylate kinase